MESGHALALKISPFQKVRLASVDDSDRLTSQKIQKVVLLRHSSPTTFVYLTVGLEIDGLTYPIEGP